MEIEFGSNNYSQLPQQKKSQDNLAHLYDGLAGQARLSFIAKVYIILGIQLMITTAMCFLAYYVQAFQQFQNDTPWIMGICAVLIIVIQITIFCCPVGRQHPYNIILLFIFTLAFSYIVSNICALVAYESGGQVVVVAACMTLAMVVGLTVYAIFTKSDFTTKWGIVIVISMSMLMLALFSIFITSSFLDNLYCCLGVILFGIYLVIDTQMIIGGKNRRLQLSLDDYVIGAMMLYIDIIEIFLYLLALLSKKN